jgi:hypothetical protein
MGYTHPAKRSQNGGVIRRPLGRQAPGRRKTIGIFLNTSTVIKTLRRSVGTIDV